MIVIALPPHPNLLPKGREVYTVRKLIRDAFCPHQLLKDLIPVERKRALPKGKTRDPKTEFKIRFL